MLALIWFNQVRPADKQLFQQFLLILVRPDYFLYDKQTKKCLLVGQIPGKILNQLVIGRSPVWYFLLTKIGNGQENINIINLKMRLSTNFLNIRLKKLGTSPILKLINLRSSLTASLLPQLFLPFSTKERCLKGFDPQQMSFIQTPNTNLIQD